MGPAGRGSPEGREHRQAKHAAVAAVAPAGVAHLHVQLRAPFLLVLLTPPPHRQCELGNEGSLVHSGRIQPGAGRRLTAAASVEEAMETPLRSEGIGAYRGRRAGGAAALFKRMACGGRGKSAAARSGWRASRQGGAGLDGAGCFRPAGRTFKGSSGWPTVTHTQASEGR